MDLEKGVQVQIPDGNVSHGSVTRLNIDEKKNPVKTSQTLYVKDIDEDFYEEEDDEFQENRCTRCTDRCHSTLCGCVTRHKTLVKYAIYTTLILLYAAYFVYAIIHDVYTAVPLIVLTFLVLLLTLSIVVHRNFGAQIQNKCCVPCFVAYPRLLRYIRW